MSSGELASTIEAICEWTIDNFVFFPKKWSLLSHKFQLNPKSVLEHTCWYLELLRDDESESIVCYLIRGVDDRGPPIIELSYEISIIEIDGCSRRALPLTFSPQPYSFRKGSKGDSIEKFGHGIDVNAFLVNGTLTVRCRMWGFGVISPMYYMLRTHNDVQKRYFKWTIKRFSSIKKRDYVLPFYVNDEVFELQFILSVEGPESEIQIEIKYIPRGQKFYEHNVFCQICLLDVKGNVATSKKDKFLFVKGQIWRFPPFMTKERLLNNKELYIQNNTLSLQFEVTSLWKESFFESVEVIQFGGLFENHEKVKTVDVSDGVLDPSDSNMPSFVSNSLMKGLFDLYQERKFCDVILKTNTSSFRVHKMVLCARSSVFTAMFEQDMKENRSGIVEITDLTDDTIHKLIKFMYTGTLQNMQWESARRLYTASDKYEIAELKNMCRSFLIANMNISNVIDVLVLSDLHQDPNLKSASLDFVFEHDSELIHSDIWKSFIHEQKELAADIMYSLYIRKMKK